MLKDIRVFIGGSVDKNISDSYSVIAKDLGTKINDRDYKIVFDGCYGLPWIVYSCLEGFDRAIIYHTFQYGSSYIDNWYRNGNSKIYSICQLENQSKMTDTIIDASDAFIFMKGQMGTIEEISRIINGKKNKEHNKPLVILNVNNEWDDLVSLLDSCNIDDCYFVTDNVSSALDYIERELFKDTSDFYKNYVSRGFAERDYPIVGDKKIVKELKCCWQWEN